MLPLLAFLAALVAFDIKVATVVLMVGCVIQVASYWVLFRRFEKMHVITMLAVLVFGALTLGLNDSRFIKWKPTFVNWVFTLILFGTQFFGKKPGIQYVLGGQIKLPDLQWRNLNVAWALFFLVLGLLNLYFAFWFRTEGDISGALFGVVTDEAARDKEWGFIKVFGSMGLTMLFAIGSMLMVARHLELDETNSDGEETDANGEITQTKTDT